MSKKNKTLRFGAVIIAVAAAVFTLTGSAGGGISPVGDQIAFMSKADGEADIYTMNMTGFANFNLTHDKAVGLRADVEPAWSADGSYVVFQRNLLQTANLPASHLVGVARDGAKLWALTPPVEGITDTHPSVSPDGSAVAFASDRDGNFDLYLVKANGEGLMQLTFTKGGIENISPAFSPDGTKIVFARREVDVMPTPLSLYVLDLATGMTFQVTRPFLMGYGDTDPSWSPDGTKIAFASDRMSASPIRLFDLWIVNLNGTGLTQITMDTSNEYHPWWTGSMKELVFVSDLTGATELYAIDLSAPQKTASLRQLTFDGAEKAHPVWQWDFSHDR